MCVYIYVNVYIVTIFIKKILLEKNSENFVQLCRNVFSYYLEQSLRRVPFVTTTHNLFLSSMDKIIYYSTDIPSLRVRLLYTNRMFQ